MWSESTFSDTRSPPSPEPQTSLESGIAAFGAGDPVLIHDASDRENEVDLVFPARAVTPADVAIMRNDAGGLICVALGHRVAEIFELPFLEDVIDHAAGTETTIAYDDRSSFSIPVNHRETYTGITDNDRARTIRALGRAAEDPGGFDFPGTFDTPGHVHLLRAAPGLLADRQGHTELGLALAGFADLPPAVVVCEMIDDSTGGALSKPSAAEYASDNDLVLLDGETIVAAVDGGPTS